MRPAHPHPLARSLVALASLATLLAGCAAPQAVISGRVVLAPLPRPSGPLPAGVERDPRAAVVYLESIPDSLLARLRLAPGPDAVAIDQRADGFHPAVAAVPAGGTLVYRNRDQVFHRPFARAGADSFDTGAYRPGETRTVRMNAPGRFPVFCFLHPGELGLIAVTPTRVVAQPARDGGFRLPALPLGHYVLHVWHPAYGEVRREVELADPRGARVEIDF